MVMVVGRGGSIGSGADRWPDGGASRTMFARVILGEAIRMAKTRSGDE